MTQTHNVETTFRVRYAETDAMGVVYHANYLVWFEVGRGEYFRAMGQDYGDWEQRGYLLPVSEVYARFHAPARYSELITVRTRVETLRSRSLTLAYEIQATSTEQLLVSGWTKHICMGPDGRARRLPQDMLSLLEPP
ncbi:MAG: thioesterase family protein [Anaerolineae bacterium]|jgi:acyl-CoA thioester hydrolase